MRIEKGIAFGLGGLVGLTVVAIGALSVRFHRGRQRAERVWGGSHFPKLKRMGTAKRLSVLPLIDWYTATDDLAGEPGVSYLVRADDTTILFDVGFNTRWEHPSPLLRNMEALGVDPEEVDSIVISHVHGDHVGGLNCQAQNTFALSGEPVDLNGLSAWVPQPLTHPTADVRVVEEPQVIAPGVAIIGTIPRQMFFLGWTLEQSLAVNVEGKGIVLIIGCGHPTLERIVERAEMCFDAPIYGVIGGLHYPVTASRSKFLGGLPAQRLLGTGKWPWDPINEKDVEASISHLRHRQPQLVALSPHDSCDWSIRAFQKAFGDNYEEVLVGQEIVL